MPRNKNKRKAKQKAQQEQQSKRTTGFIAHVPHGGSGVQLALVVLMAFPDLMAKPAVEPRPTTERKK